MKKAKSIVEMKIWERDRNGERGSSPDYFSNICRKSVKIKGGFLSFETIDGNTVAYNTESVFKYEIEPI